MEVHHHAHTSRKKWTHYLWEFVMLFLAVFCGFLAEYQLEHTIEHQRAKKYASNLLDELKKDTARLTYLMNLASVTSGKLDSLTMLIKDPGYQAVTSGMLYYYADNVLNVTYFASHNSTLEQLKNSGSLRMMKINVGQMISEYDKKIRELEKEYGLSKSEFEKMETLHFKVFDVYTLEELFTDDTSRITRDSVFRLNTLYVTKDREMMNEYAGWVKFEANIYRMQSKEYLAPIRKNAEELIATLKKEYHLK